jgi:peroxiredoxin
MPIRVGVISLLFVGLLAVSAWLLLGIKHSPAPDVTFITISGGNIELKAQHGKPVIVTFWATDCPACIKEIPHLKELYNVYHNRGLEIIAVAMYYDPPNHVVAMTQAKQLPYDIALDLQGEHARAFGEVRLTPTTFLIAPDGTVNLKKTGSFDIHDMKNRIENMLKG